MSNPQDTLRRRLRFRSWHRGWKEHDLLFGSFADSNLAALTEDELQHYEALLSRDDPELDDWIAGRVTPPPGFDTPVLARLRAHRAQGLAVQGVGGAG